MKRATTHFEQVPRAIAEKVLAREIASPETEVAESGGVVKPKVTAAPHAFRVRKV